MRILHTPFIQIGHVLLLFFIACFYFSCNSSNNDSSSTTVRHPVEEKIPHYNRDHILINSSDSFEKLKEKPGELVLLNQYLQEPENIILERLEVEVGSPFPAFNVVAVDKNRLVILDDNRNELLEFNIINKKATTIAEFGRGPGDVQFPLEMVIHDEMIYVLRQDMYISIFDCMNEPCTFKDVISLEFNPASLTFSDDNFAILGTKFESQTSDTETEKAPQNSQPIHLIDHSGNQFASFGSMYDVDGHWMLIRPFVMSGDIRFASVENVYSLTFKRFPFVYIYDQEDHSLTESYKLSDFLLGKQSYWPDERRLRNPEDDYTIIKNIQIYEEHLLLIETETKTNYRITETSILWDRKFDYYILDLTTKKDYYLGNYEYKAEEPGKRVFLTGLGIVIYDEKEGALFLGSKIEE